MIFYIYLKKNIRMLEQQEIQDLYHPYTTFPKFSDQFGTSRAKFRI
jgi:hypothetical protein